ncbi:MAG: hypothetical protein ACJAWM_001668 [Sulfitobacter sp.]|jgi:hypothetical protein
MRPVDVGRIFPAEIMNLLDRVFGRFAGRPARDVTLWLACIPLVLPAPVIAAIIAISKLNAGSHDERWRQILMISALNFVLSTIVLAWGSTILGGWMTERLHDLFGPLFLFSPKADATSVSV